MVKRRIHRHSASNHALVPTIPGMRGHLFVDMPLAAVAISATPAFGWPVLAAVGGLSVAIHSWGVVNPRSSLYMPVTWRLRREARDLALTFDDGPNPDATPRLLDVLATHGLSATFFVIGEHVARHPELARRIRAGGHALGLHSHTHSRLFNCWTPGRVRSDLEACAMAVSQATGEAAPRLFRPPVGLKNPVVGHVAGRLGLCTVTWTARGRDIGASSTDAVLRRLAPSARPGAILLLHDGYEPTRPGQRSAAVAVTEALAPLLSAAGMTSRALEVVDGRARLRREVAMPEPAQSGLGPSATAVPSASA